MSCFLSAAYVETGKLTVAISQVDEVHADEIVNLPAKKRGLLGTLLVSALRSLWTKWTAPSEHGQVQDATYTQVSEEEPADAAVEAEPTGVGVETGSEQKKTESVDEELNRVVNMFKLLRESGYTLRIIPGTPEENAPVFDFDQERIIQKAA